MSDPDAADRDRSAAPRRGPSVDLGIFAARGEPGLAAADLAAIALSILWVLGAGAVFLLGGDQAPGRAGGAVDFALFFIPLALIWGAAVTARAVRGLRAETARLQAAVDGLRQAQVAQQQTATTGGPRTETDRKLDALIAAQRKTEAALAALAARDAAPAAAERADAQPGLALGTPEEALRLPLDNATLIRAMNFPETAEDRRGFRAMRQALDDPDASRLIRAAQDMLTLLSEDGIYMDDLEPDRARPEVWRRFAGGERGRTVSALGGVHDRDCLEKAAARMKQDQIFRDAAHHFLRTFDRSIAAFEPGASDAEIAAAADTRTARAFMLLGRVAGTFD